VGYAGGRRPDPTYRHIGDHTETVQVDYDPKRITFEQLLDIFWKSHTPTSPSRSGQYMRAVFYHDENQRRQAEASKAALEKELGRTVHTRVVPLRSFTMAEDYHQKYLLKQQRGLNAEMSRIYPAHRNFVDSTAVARINGYAGGNGSKKQFEREIDKLGLSDASRQALRTIMERHWDYDRQ
jgi:peptide-methionine (S)-S-oxide reductase